MKNYTFLVILSSVLSNVLYAQVKIGGAAEIPHASAVLELDGGNNRGLLLPRMRKMDIDAIQNPAEGLTIYATDQQVVYLRRSGNWVKMNGDADAFSLPYIGVNSNSESSFEIRNINLSSTSKAIEGESTYGNGIYGISTLGIGVTGIAVGEDGIAGRFQNINGGTGMLCEGTVQLLGKNGALIRFFDATKHAKGFIQQVDSDLKIGTLASNDPGRFIIRTNNLDRLWVDSVGYVTIGGRIGPTLNGPYRLAVRGKIAATDFNVVASGSWPDYVFDPSYKLRSLEETEAYINEHKHLPNIPAAAVVDKEGFALGDMQKRMMEKIEELTLHLIAANKATKELSASVVEAKNEISLLKNQIQALDIKK